MAENTSTPISASARSASLPDAALLVNFSRLCLATCAPSHPTANTGYGERAMDGGRGLNEAYYRDVEMLERHSLLGNDLDRVVLVHCNRAAAHCSASAPPRQQRSRTKELLLHVRGLKDVDHARLERGDDGHVVWQDAKVPRRRRHVHLRHRLGSIQSLMPGMSCGRGARSHVLGRERRSETRVELRGDCAGDACAHSAASEQESN